MSDRPPEVGSGPPKLGSVTTLLPPETETPGTRAAPRKRSPEPPGPANDEVPVRGEASAPLPAPVNAAPEPEPAEELPEPLPLAGPEPPPAPPVPNAVPAGDIASIAGSG